MVNFKSLQLLRHYSKQVIYKNDHKAINKILIANRGEIACRVIKTARRLGIRTVAIYSEADKLSLHTSQADEAHYVGPAPSQLSYLKGETILNIAKKSGCQAIHPGYGFLSENVEFAELCERENITFMGPPASAIRDMGIKNCSKAIMEAAGVPIIKGYHGDDQSNSKLIEEADKIGFPLMIKAVRGGGGKGMRISYDKHDFLNALESARTESKKAFGDSAVLLERFVTSPRHVEVQIFGDRYGNYVYLNERDCSVQRRHQKIIEEAPGPGISQELRQQLGEAAVRAAKAVGYVGAGTVEFILDKNDLSFHFMEMNTRLQVEHPITEMITNTDLVEWQIRVAAGEKLPVTQQDIPCNGHAFEARIYAENPRNNFLPGAGPLLHLRAPQENQSVRVETGVRQGDEVSIHYDPMIAKLVVWGENRSDALNKLIANLKEYQITGLDTNINFLIDLANHSEFRLGNVHTGFIDQHYDSLFPKLTISDNHIIQAACAIHLLEQNALKISYPDKPFLWNNFRLNKPFYRKLPLTFNNKEYIVHIETEANDMKMKVNDDGEWKGVQLDSNFENNSFNISSNIDGETNKFSAFIDETSIVLFTNKGMVNFKKYVPKYMTEIRGEGESGENRIISPMPGVLEKLFVKSNDVVKKGDQLAVIVAMKMEYVLKASSDGIIDFVSGKLGKNLEKGETVISFKSETNVDRDEDKDEL